MHKRDHSNKGNKFGNQSKSDTKSQARLRARIADFEKTNASSHTNSLIYHRPGSMKRVGT